MLFQKFWSVIVYKGIGYSVFANLQEKEEGANDIQLDIVFEEDITVAPLTIKQSDLIRMYKHLLTDNADIVNIETKEMYNRNRAVYEKFRNRAFDLRKQSSVMNPDEIITIAI